MNQQITRFTDCQELELNQDEIQCRIHEFKLAIKGDCDINPAMRQDDEYLLRYLHASDFNVANAHLKFKKFYNLLADNTKWFCYATPKSHEGQLRKQIRIMLDTRDREGRLIIIAKMANTNVANTSILDVMKLDDIMLELGWDDPITLRKGYCGILDVKDMSFRLMSWATPSNIMFCVRKLDALPLKDLKIHIVNKSRYLDTLIALAWPFMPRKFKENIFIHHDDWESLHQFIDPASLPEEYGGTNMKSYDEYINEALAKDQEIIEATKYLKFFVND